MIPPLGIIEGYYGPIWPEADRVATILALAPRGYGFFIHAPKGDAFLRRRWREPHPPEARAMLERLSGACVDADVRFGVGLSPYELYRGFGDDEKAALGAKLRDLDALGVRELAILFDDMRGDLPNLARNQADILHWIGERTAAERLIVCPSYYSDDPVLDRVFGERPPRYLEDLGRALDPAIEVFWTGPEVCSREYTAGHLARVAETLGRAPALWDNYPVNDGPVMSDMLHLRAFTGRGGARDHISRHAVNPANQPTLSRIPAITLAEAYRLADTYDYGAAWRSAADDVLGAVLAALVERHLYLFQESGLSRLDADTRERLRARYAEVDHPAAAEIRAWLDGAYAVTREMVETS